MTWEEIIEMRRRKEAMKQEMCTVQIPVQLYQMAIGEALQRLTPLERQAVGLRYLKDLPIATVASKLGMSWEGADALIDRGILNVQRFLKGSKYEHKGKAKIKPPVLDQEALEELEEIYTDVAP